MKILCIEDGSVDMNKLEQEGLKDGKILVYRQGSKPPYILEFDNINETGEIFSPNLDSNHYDGFTETPKKSSTEYSKKTNEK